MRVSRLLAPRLVAPGIGAALALLAATPAAAQQCAESLTRLDQRIAALEAGGVQGPPLSRTETTALRGMRQAAERLGQSGNADACTSLVRDAMGAIQSIEKPTVVSAQDIEKLKLQGSQGEKIGSIEEVIVDPNTGRVAYAVVGLGGFLGIGERSFPVPWAAFQPAPDGDGLVLNIPRDRLTGAPQFGGDNRPNMADRQWALAVHTYYGVEPYWTQGASAFSAGGQGAQAQAGAANPQLEQEVQRLSQEVQRLTQDLSRAQASTPAPAAGSSGDPNAQTTGQSAPAQAQPQPSQPPQPPQ